MTTRRRKATDVAEDRAVAQQETLGQLQGQHFKVKMTRKTDDGRWPYVGTFEITPDLWDEVAARKGGGSYRGMVYDGTQYKKQTLEFDIDGPPKVEAVSAPAALVAAPAPDPMEMALKIVQAMKEGGNGSAGGISAEIAQQRETAAMALGKELGELKARVEHRERPAPKEGGDAWAEALRDFGKELIPALIPRQPQRQLPAPRGPAGPVVSNPPTEPMTMTDYRALPDEYAWLIELRPLYGRLIKEANKDSNCHAIAVLAYENMDDALLHYLAPAIHRADIIPVLQAEMPTMPAAWLAEFVAELRDLIDDAAAESAEGKR